MTFDYSLGSIADRLLQIKQLCWIHSAGATLNRQILGCIATAYVQIREGGSGLLYSLMCESPKEAERLLVSVNLLRTVRRLLFEMQDQSCE